MTLAELADRCEQVAGPDRELDALVHCAIKGWQFSRAGGEFFGTTQAGERFTVGLPERLASDTAPTHHNMRSDSLAPRYTASLDAAMTLVPEGWWVQHIGYCLNGWRARVERNVDRSTESIGIGFGCDAPIKTPALALCAAALRARSA